MLFLFFILCQQQQQQHQRDTIRLRNLETTLSIRERTKTARCSYPTADLRFSHADAGTDARTDARDFTNSKQENIHFQCRSISDSNWSTRPRRRRRIFKGKQESLEERLEFQRLVMVFPQRCELARVHRRKSRVEAAGAAVKSLPVIPAHRQL